MGRTQEEKRSSVRGGARVIGVSQLVWILWLFADFHEAGMSLTLEQVVTQLQQEAITLKAKVLIELGLQMQYVPSTISRQLKFGKTFRVSLI